MALLTPGDLQLLLGDPAAVSAWLEGQHRLPPAQRTPGLPPNLSSPRARADLLLNPPLLARALRESVPFFWSIMLHTMQQSLSLDDKDRKDTLLPFSTVKRGCHRLREDERTMAYHFCRQLHMDRRAALESATCLRDKMRRFYSDPNTESEYNRVRTQLPDSWRLRQFVFTSPN